MTSKSKIWLPIVIATVGISSSLCAQQTSHKVDVQASHFAVRFLGPSTLRTPLRAGSARSQSLTRKQSRYAPIHGLAHQWGAVMARKNNAAETSQPPYVAAFPIVAPDQGFTGFAALTGSEQASASGFDLEPPDQGLCTDGQAVMEAVNLANSVYDATSHKVLAGPVYLNDFFGVPASDFTSDPRCYYDPPTQRWFATLTDLGSGGPTSLLVAVSQSSDPAGSYNLYAFDVTSDGYIGACPCFGDQPLLGADANGFYISTNSYGATSFGGAQLYALSKYALVLGIVPFGVHLAPLSPPGGSPFPFSLQPATSPDGQGDSRNGGTEYFVSTFDDFSLTNQKVSVWAMTNTDTLNAELGIPGFTALSLNTEPYVLPNPAAQKAGPIPLGKSLGEPEGMLNPDDERMQQVVYADGNLWSSVGTALQVGKQVLDGAAYFIIQPKWSNGVLQASVTKQGYVATANNNLIYPAIGVNAAGKGAMVFTLTGADYYPSAAYIPINLNGTAKSIRLAAKGALPDDGFTIYQAFGGNGVGRWGDYSAAVAVSDDSIWIATEYISNKKRDHYTNWGTFVGMLPLADGD